MKILLRDFNAKLGRDDIFKLTVGNESLHQDSIVIILKGSATSVDPLINVKVFQYVAACTSACSAAKQ